MLIKSRKYAKQPSHYRVVNIIVQCFIQIFVRNVIQFVCRRCRRITQPTGQKRRHRRLDSITMNDDDDDDDQVNYRTAANAMHVDASTLYVSYHLYEYTGRRCGPVCGLRTDTV